MDSKDLKSFFTETAKIGLNSSEMFGLVSWQVIESATSKALRLTVREPAAVKEFFSYLEK